MSAFGVRVDIAISRPNVRAGGLENHGRTRTQIAEVENIDICAVAHSTTIATTVNVAA
jgi:hypothetical protein